MNTVMDDLFSHIKQLRNDILTSYKDAKILHAYKKLIELENIILDDNKQCLSDNITSYYIPPTV